MFRTLVFAACLYAAPALSQEPLSDAALKEQVGGLRTPAGLEFNFGAVVSTYVDGRLALKSQLTYTDQGVLRTTAGGDVAGSDIAGIHVDGNEPGLFVPGSNGGTVILHDLSDGRIANIVLNTANNRDVRQETVISLDIPDLTSFQADVTGQQFDMRLQTQVSDALKASTR